MFNLAVAGCTRIPILQTFLLPRYTNKLVITTDEEAALPCYDRNEKAIESNTERSRLA